MSTLLKTFTRGPELFTLSLIPGLRAPRALNPNTAFIWSNLRSYSDKVHDHFNNPRNVGSIPNDDDVGTAIVGKAACGDVIKLQVRVRDSDGVISEVKFKTFGCGSAIASSSLASELIRGKTIDQAMALSNIDIANHLSLPPVKLHCSLLAEDAIKHAINDYKRKKGEFKAVTNDSDTKPVEAVFE